MDFDLQLDATSTLTSASSLEESFSEKNPGYLERIRDAITEKTFCRGTFEVSPEQCILFYGKETGRAGRIDLSAATDDELADLVRVCDPATFGQGHVDVLDESYRKARKLDTSHFASKFDLGDSGLMKKVHSELLEGEDHLKSIHAELYKLNIKDRFSRLIRTPFDQSRCLALSLSCFLPPTHEGGALTLRHAGKEWTFDSAKAISEQTAPSIAYIAFFSDVEHEVALVTSGYRVTLTYNLYFSEAEAVSDSTKSEAPNVHPSEESVKAIFEEFLADSTFLPDGGRLGFGLSYQYPFGLSNQYPYSSYSIGQWMLRRLKGSDALIFRICQHYSLKAVIRVVYEGREGEDIMCPDFVPVSEDDEIQDVTEYLTDECQGVELVQEVQAEEGLVVNWVTNMNELNTHRPRFIAYGNQASIQCMYGQLVLIVKIGPATKRSTMEE